MPNQSQGQGHAASRKKNVGYSVVQSNYACLFLTQVHIKLRGCYHKLTTFACCLSQITRRCVTESVCQVGVDSSYIDDGNCRGYIVCVAGDAFRFVCPGQLVFNAQLHVCDFDLHDRCPSPRGNLFHFLNHSRQRIFARRYDVACVRFENGNAAHVEMYC